MVFNRIWATPSADTFDITPIGEFVKKYLRESKVSIDPFARNKRWATYTNDLNPDTAAEWHCDAAEFLGMLRQRGVMADLLIFDPPYSPGQIVECYSSIGLEVANAGQNGALYKRVRDEADKIINPGGIVLSFGWNSAGMGRERGYQIVELLLVPHGGGHNDTICLAECKIGHQLELF